MSAVEVFQFPENGREIRTVEIDGQRCVVAADVCAAIGIQNARRTVERLDADGVRQAYVIDSMGREQLAYVLTESGLYELVLRSDKPDAKPFRRWVTSDVLPTIRRTGGYGVQQRHEIPQTYAQALQLAATQAAEIEQQRAQLAIATPKAEYVDSFVNPTEDASTIRVFAGQINVGEQALRDYLRRRKVIYRRLVEHRWSRSKQAKEPVYEWLAYSEYRTWFQAVDQPQAPRLHNGQMSTTLYVTPVGKAAIRRLLMKHPMAEDGAA